MSFSIDYDNQPLKFLKKQDKFIAKIILDKIEGILPGDPVPHNSKSLIGQHNCFRIRVGDYRVLYRLNYENNKIIIFKIDKRSNVYD